MKYKLCLFVSALIVLMPSAALAANFEISGNAIVNDIAATLVYSVIGIVIAFLSYKVIDLITPGHLSSDIANNNIALAILAGLTNLGICIIIAAVLTS